MYIRTMNSSSPGHAIAFATETERLEQVECVTVHEIASHLEKRLVNILLANINVDRAIYLLSQKMSVWKQFAHGKLMFIEPLGEIAPSINP